MFKYINYLFAIIRRRVSTYLVPIITLVIITSIMSVALFQNGRETSIIPLFTNENFSFVFIFLFLFSCLFIGIKALNIFKEGETDGTELLIASKQLKRASIILGKFLTLYFVILIYSLSLFTLLFLMLSSDKYTTTSDAFKYSGSWSLGNLIIMIFFSTIISFVASIMGKIAIIAFSILIPTVFPILSLIMVQIGRGDGALLRGGASRTGIQPIKYESLEKDNVIKKGETRFAYLSSSKFDEIYNKYKKGFYKYFAPIDIWEHLKGLYAIGFEEKNFTLTSPAVKWEKNETTKFSSDQYLSIKIPTNNSNNKDDIDFTPFIFNGYSETAAEAQRVEIDKEKYFDVKDVNIEHLNTTIKENSELITSVFKYKDPESDANPNDEEIGYDNQLRVWQIVLFTKENDLTNYLGPTQSKQVIDLRKKLKKDLNISEIDYYDNLSTSFLIIYLHDVGETGKSKYKNLEVPKITKSFNWVNGKYAALDSPMVLEEMKQYGLIQGDHDTLTVEGKRYLNKKVVIAVYSILIFVFAGLVILRYFRRDFK